MNRQDRLEIPRSRSKIFFGLLGCCAFVSIGVWMTTLDQSAISHYSRHRDITFVHFIGYANIAFFGLGLFVLPKRLLDESPLFVFDSDGMTLNPGGQAETKILWKDISGVRVWRRNRQKLILVDLVDPESFMSQGSRAQIISRRATFNMCGSPLTLTAGMAALTIDELLATVEKYLNSDLAQGASPSSVTTDQAH